ncbi:hypothetical protein [Streptomyces sp. CBMA123]|nr:hypothetical protein [Streptomyces sp. CBMA123]
MLAVLPLRPHGEADGVDMEFHDHLVALPAAALLEVLAVLGFLGS